MLFYKNSPVNVLNIRVFGIFTTPKMGYVKTVNLAEKGLKIEITHLLDKGS